MKQQEATPLAADRRSFLKGAGVAGLGLAGAAMLANTPKAQAQMAYSDVDILNFALNLEYLEAEFYAVSTYGATLLQLGVITASQQDGPTTGGNMVPKFGSLPQATFATGLRNDEINHVKYLRQALGANAAKKPAINLNALGYGFANVNSWLMLARQFEDVGISAYLGAAPMLSGSAYLAAAGAILATEGQHSGALRTLCIMSGVNSPAVDSMDVPPTQKYPFDVDSNGLSIPRTPQQVLKIVYGGGTNGGGFYPNGMTGAITMS